LVLATRVINCSAYLVRRFNCRPIDSRRHRLKIGYNVHDVMMIAGTKPIKTTRLRVLHDIRSAPLFG